MKISVALCTYNGEKYIAEQLDSIIKQIRQPDEIIICDDRSTDKTVDIVRSVLQNSAIPFNIYINESQCGVRKNFGMAIQHCAGDFIALSDQDDIWLPEKLKKQEEFLKSNNYDVVFSNLYRVDEHLKELDIDMWEYAEFNALRRSKLQNNKGLEIFYEIGNVVTGCTIMMKRSFALLAVDAILSSAFEKKIHDEVIALIAMANQSIQFIDQKLMLYRQHANQVVGTQKQKVNKYGKKQFDKEDYRRYSNKLREEYNSLLKFAPENNLHFLKKKYQHFMFRGNITGSFFKRFVMVVKEYSSGNYRYSNGYLSVIKDILVK